MSEIGSHHQEQVSNYVKYTKSRREEQLKELQEVFTTFKDTQYDV